MPERPLLVTSDADLLDDLLRLCAAAGVEPQVAHDLTAARSAWASAPLVVLGDDLSRRVDRAGLGRRPDLVLVTRDLDDVDVWTRGAGLGVETVVFLPDAEALLVDRLVDSVEAPVAEATTVAAVGGRGGAGASTLAGALAVTASADGLRTLLVDADPLGGGLDLLVGAEQVPGMRWPDLAVAGGRVGAAALGSALPEVSRLRLLSWDRGDPRPVPVAAATAVLSAACRSHQVVVVDLPRRLDALAEVAVAAATTVLLVVPAEVRATAAAARVAAGLRPLAPDVRLVVRGPAPSGLTGRVVADSLGLPLVGWLRPEPGLARSLERGEAPARSGRGPLADLCRELLRQLGAASSPVAA